MLYYNVIYSTVKEIEESDSELTGALWCPNYWTFHKRYMASRSITKYSVTITYQHRTVHSQGKSV